MNPQFFSQFPIFFSRKGKRKGSEGRADRRNEVALSPFSWGSIRGLIMVPDSKGSALSAQAQIDTTPVLDLEALHLGKIFLI